MTPFTSRRALHTPSSIQSHFGIGALVFVETHRRILGGKFGSIPKAISDDAFAQGGYCIDAHELMPAGSVEFQRFGAGADEWIANPTHFEREPSAAAPDQDAGEASVQDAPKEAGERTTAQETRT